MFIFVAEPGTISSSGPGINLRYVTHFAEVIFVEPTNQDILDHAAAVIDHDRNVIERTAQVVDAVDRAVAALSDGLHHGRTSISTCHNQVVMCEHVEGAIQEAIDQLLGVRDA